jgi:iron complex outermembrane recepter protein
VFPVSFSNSAKFVKEEALIRRSITVFLLLCCSAIVASAAGSGQISGTVTDASGAAMSGVVVTVTDLTSGAVQHVVTSSDGSFKFRGLSNDTQLVTIEKQGFEPFTQKVSLATQASAEINAKLAVASLAQSVVVRGTVVPGARPMPTRDEVQNSLQTIRVLDRKQIDAAGPVAGGAQMIAFTPGANVVGYGQTGSTKYSILLNGIQQGWAGEATSFTAPGSLGITFDGIPIVDSATGLWQSATMPQDLLMQNLAVTYGPGTPEDRFYTSVGGSVEFTPIQPTVSHHFSVAASYGMYGTKNIAFVGNTGNFHGWDTVIGGGVGDSDSFRQAPDGFHNPGSNGSVFGKTIRMFSAGSFELGAYYAKAGGYRAQVIPLTDQGIIEPNGTSYSEATSGFYSTMPFDAYNKYDTNEMAIVYGRENLLLNDTTTLQNTTWFMHIRRFHRRNEDIFPSSGGADQVNEWNNPHSNAFGDKIGLQKVVPYNTVNVGFYLIHEVYNSHNLFYSPAEGGSGAEQIINAGAKFRSGYFQQDDVAFYAQDDIHPIPQIHITPGVRWVGFGTSYSDQFQRDFTLLPGVIPETHCSLFPAAADPYNNILGTPTVGLGGATTKDQGSLCASHESRNAVEPSIDVGVMPLPWLTIYGGYDVTYRSPALGGGGGMFQSVDPTYYLLAKGAYSQVGVKVHFTDAPALKNFIVGVNYYHLDYTNQELDYELANGFEGTNGGSSAYHGVDAFFDDDPMGNLHIFLNFSGESANFTNYIVGGNSVADCEAQVPNPCTFFNNLPVSYVPSTTLNVGAYYGIVRNDHTLIEPHFWINYTGSQHLFDNNLGRPSTVSMPSYTTANLSLTAPIKWFNVSVNMLNIFNSRYNQWEYISSGGYFGTATAGYINAYPGAPFTTYGTISYQF